MNSFEYMPLNSWLSNADYFYIDGRLLWLQMGGIGGGCVLLWLAFEQIFKSIIFQSRIQKKEYKSRNADRTHSQFNAWGKKIGHDINDVAKAFQELYPNFITREDIEHLGKVYEYFERRYAKNTSTGININLLNDLDELYFRLRDLFSKDLPVALIDEIAIRKDKGIPSPIQSYMQWAYIDNPHFRVRPKYRA